jgi:hypothetical protein
MKSGRGWVMTAALVAAGIYAVTGATYLADCFDQKADPPQVAIWWATLWLIGACSVTAAGIGQARAHGIGRVFALSVLAVLIGAGLAGEALGLAAVMSDRSLSTVTMHETLHWIGFALSWPVFLLTLVEDVFALAASGPVGETEDPLR